MARRRQGKPGSWRPYALTAGVDALQLEIAASTATSSTDTEAASEVAKSAAATGSVVVFDSGKVKAWHG